MNDAIPTSGNPYGPPTERRWLKFSVRTLAIALTLIGAWLGWQWRIVHKRKAIRHMVIAERGGFMDNHQQISAHLFDELPPPELPWVRRWMGDESFRRIGYAGMTKQEVSQIKRSYPEVELIGSPLGN